MPAPRTCECMTCPKCNVREWARTRYRLKAYGQWDPYADLEAVTAHVANLRANGHGVGSIATAARVSRSQVERIANRRSQRIGHAVATRILAVSVDQRGRIPAYRVARRLQALNALGYSTRHLADMLDTNQDVISDHLAGKRKWVQRRTMGAVAELYDRLSMTPGGNAASARIAAANGHRPPLAWDDIDDPDETPGTSVAVVVMDPVIVERLTAGHRVDHSTPAEKTEALRRWLTTGRSETEFCRIHGWRPGRYKTTKAAA